MSACSILFAHRVKRTSVCDFCLSIGEIPSVIIGGSNKKQPVIYGGSVTFECTSPRGIPPPEITWSGAPIGSIVDEKAGVSTLTIPQLVKRLCVSCVATNVIGQDEKRECVDVISKLMVRG